MLFVSRLMVNLCRLLRTDGLEERFNQMLKRMLKNVVDEEWWNWDLLGPYILFAIQETLQASTCFPL